MDFSLCPGLRELSLSIQQIASSPSNFVLHRSQCCCLARTYTLAIDHVAQQLHHTLSASNNQNTAVLNNLLSELHHCMLQGHKFMQDCSFQDGWVRKALTLAFTSEAQDVCLHDLIWCLCVFRQAMRQLPSATVELQDEVFSLLNDVWTQTSQKDDSLHLINVLKDNVADWEHQLSQGVLPMNLQEEVCLAKFLLQKLMKEDSFHDVGASNDLLLECLWVDPHQFTIKESIGHGTFAVVHEVEWFGQRFGQKEFFGVDERFFGKEAAIQARLRHPNVLQLICCTSKPSMKKCSLVTELMDMDLRRAIDNRSNDSYDPPFPLLVAVDIMLQIAKGMEYLHGLHIMHRDLKSQNLLVKNHVSSDDNAQCNGRMRVKVADFGLSKAKYTSSKYTSLHTGTTYWRAPEVFKVDGKRETERRYTKKADVYSFAMVCYEILTGKVPFDDGEKLSKLHKRLLRGERPILPISCPQYLASYIERCWHANPVKRPSFAQISRTLRHLKAILLPSFNLVFSSALTHQFGTNIEDKLEQTIGADWVATTSSAFTTKALTIAFEMSWYNVIESKLTKQQEAAAIIKKSSSGDFISNFVCSLRWKCGRCLGQVRDTIDDDSGVSKLDTDTIFQHYTIGDSDERTQPLLRRFTFKELYRATNHFDARTLLGRGATGNVYKTTLADGQMVAIKVFSNPSGALLGKQFATEIRSLGRIRHRNLVPLLGFCSEDHHSLLVYKFMPGGDLSSVRHRGITLTWAQKYNIVRGLASALDYLHNGCTPRILHRDVKPSNILLDADQEACLSDFGIARLLSTTETHVTTTVRGTHGYLAPEYAATLKLGPEVDVYGFGVVVLELACERRGIERDDEFPHIVQYAWTLHQQNSLLYAVCEKMDRVGLHYDEEELLRLLHLGLACTQGSPKDRPAMDRVVQVMSKELEAPIPVRAPYYM